MKFSDYEHKDKDRYEALAKLIRDTLQAEINARQGLPRIQTIQFRSKGVNSLRRKLEKRGLLEADDIQNRIKDLAGTRVILYSDMDVERFLQSRLIIECLEVHWDETKAHYPTTENDGIKYEGFHYVVSVPESLAKKHPELAGLRCEIQIQTLLAHAFAESSHDIIYKDEDTPGFGTKIRESMRKRLNEMVDKYLKPAGSDLDKVQADFERLTRGRELFEQKELDKLRDTKDNNELYDRLEGISEYLIPQYDDLSAVTPELHKVLCAVVEIARQRPTQDIDFGGYKLGGHSAEDVVRLVVEIISDYRFADVESTVDALIHIYKTEQNREIRQQIVEVTEKLAGYNLQVWRQVGPNVQLYLSDRLSKMTTEEIEAIRPMATAIWRELLGWNIEGTTWTSNAVQISKGAVPASEPLKDIRKLAIDGLTGLLDRSQDDNHRRPIISAFWEAAQLPMQSNYSNETLTTAIADLTTIADILLPRLDSMDFHLWQTIESHLFREYKRFNALGTSNEDAKGCRDQARALVDAIKSIRNRMNRSREYVRFKTLVGFEGIFSQQWDNDAFGFEEVERLRKTKAAKYVEQITAANEEKWLATMRTCAATKSNDWATFPIFGEFMTLLGERKPQTALKVIAGNEPDLLNFLPSLLAGLSKSSAQKEYKELVQDYIAKGSHLSEIARVYRFKDDVTLEQLKELLDSAIKHKEDLAIIECLVCSIVKSPTLGDCAVTGVFLPAVSYLTSQKDCRWVRGAWFLPAGKELFARLSERQAQAVLDNLTFAKKITHEYERVLACIGKVHADLVWRYFRDRLLKEDDDQASPFESIPYQLHDLPRVLGRDPLAAIKELRSWYKAGDNRFQFTGGRLLHAIYPACTKELADAAVQATAACTDDDIEFLLNCFRPYRGESTLHPVAQMIVRAIPGDDQRLGLVEILLENTGVVSGEYGMADAMRERKALLKGWLTDANAKVRDFAERTIKRLDNRIATETREADARKQRRKRDYGEE